LYVYAGNDPINHLDPSGLLSVFGWRGVSVPVGEVGPFHGEVEGVGIVGYDFASSRGFESVIGAAGAEVGPIEAVGGVEVSASLSGGGVLTTGIGLFGVNVPLGGLEASGGLYRTGSGEWGWYGGGGVGAFGFHSSWGVGASLPSSVQTWLEAKLSSSWSTLKKACPIK
jgi:hypothetical protein